MSKLANILAFKRSDVERLYGTNFGSRNAYPAAEEGWPAVWSGPRPALETDPTFLQPIPYIIVRRMVDGAAQYLTYQRGASGGESRLHGRLSIGIGGHIDASDARYNKDGTINFDNTLRVSSYREMDEEIGMCSNLVKIGYIQTDSDEVGQVHFGIIQMWDATAFFERAGEFTFEDTIEGATFRTKQEILGANNMEIEEWTALALALL